MSEGDVEYVEEIVVQRRPADTVKSRSRKNARYQSDLLRRDGTIAGPTESRALNDSDIDALQRRPGTELPESDMAADQDLGRC